MTVGLPPSLTAITELVVPRSIPTAFAMSRLISGYSTPWRHHTSGQIAGRSRSSSQKTGPLTPRIVRKIKDLSSERTVVTCPDHLHRRRSRYAVRRLDVQPA